MTAYLSRPQFLSVVRHALLVSVDLVIVNSSQQALLGYRKNRPAQHTWFVPGGRMLKNERIPETLQRVARSELGLDLQAMLDPGGAVSEANVPTRFLGVYEHLYDDNFAGHPDIGTHIIVLAYRVSLDALLLDLPTEQHSCYRWLDIDALLTCAEVHENTKAYFRQTPAMLP